MRRAIVCAMALVLAGVGAGPVAADHEPDPWGCPIHIDETSADNPNVVDEEGDYNGVITGNESAAPYGDIYREGTDLTKAWLHRDNETGDVTGVIEVVEISGPQPNAMYYLLWDHQADDDESPTTWWVSGRMKVGDNAFTYGYMAEGVTGTQFFTVGETTGSIEEGSPGRIVIDVPLAELGDPQYGDTLENFTAESRILVGSPEPLPDPSPLRHGFVFEVDNTDDAIDLCDVYVNEPSN